MDTDPHLRWKRCAAMKRGKCSNTRTSSTDPSQDPRPRPRLGLVGECRKSWFGWMSFQRGWMWRTLTEPVVSLRDGWWQDDSMVILLYYWQWGTQGATHMCIHSWSPAARLKVQDTRFLYSGMGAKRARLQHGVPGAGHTRVSAPIFGLLSHSPYLE